MSGVLPESAVAIIGMAGRFPGADDVAAFWRNIRAGVSSIIHFSPEELEDAFSEATRDCATFVPARAILRDVDRFDAEFFGMRPREAALTDPQHRLLLECAWSALEDGGYDPSRYSGAIGVFAGCSMNTYLLTNVLADRAAAESFASDFQVGSYDTLMGAMSDTLATRLAYKLNLRGPAMTVQSACSTSLLAVAQACQSLLLYQSDMALAGGVSITFPQKRGYLHRDGGMVSADGVCRPFDADATGTVFADGGAMVLLKRLEDAVEDGDHIYAVIRGCAVNNDGSDKVGFTAPSVQGQAAAIASAHAAADVDPRTIGYVECHGTATPLGDPIEFAGLVKAFGQQHVEGPFCALGSAKANVGHMDVAAGIGGLIKAALALHHREIPPLANFRSPNPHLNLSGSPFYIPDQTLMWQRGRTPRRAGVSALGVGGTNVHVVLEEAPHCAPAVARPRAFHVLPLSARSEAALARLSENLAAALESNPALAPADVAHTLQTGRRRFAVRRTVVCRGDGADAVAQLRQSSGVPQAAGEGAAPIVFMFPGQGAQHAGMGKAIYEEDTGFRADIDRGAAVLEPLIGVDLRQTMFAADSDEALKSTLLAQTSLFLLEYALARLWMRWGVKPDAMIGHSLGEFAAASIAGVFAFEDGLSLVAARARLMQAQPSGAMLAMRLGEDEARLLIGETLDLAAINAPSLCVASGSDEAIAAIERELAARRVGCRRLHTSHAFHSRAMDPVVEQIEAIVRGISLSPASTPYASCLNGAWSDAAQQTSPRYWASHCREPVRFAQALEMVVGDRQPILLEVGPGRTLSMLAAQATSKQSVRAIVASLPGAQERADPRRQLALAAGELWKHGAPLDWSALDPGGRRTPLPTYPFERRRHWIDPPARLAASAAAPPLPSNDESAIAMPALSTDTADKRVQAQAAVIDLLESLSGDSLDAIDSDATFIELGFDSLFLGQVAQAIQTKFGLPITFRQLLGDVPSIAAVATLLETKLPDAPPFPSEVAPSFAMTSGATVAPPDDMQALFAMQAQAMQRLFAEQLRTLQAGGARSHAQPAATQPAPSASIGSPAEGEAPSRFSVYRPAAATTSAQSLSEKQQRFIDDLVTRVNAATPRAKALTQENRAVLADPRSAAGFRAQWKELVYPIVCARSKGARIWDIDGNEYIDLVNGYGQTAFGHAPDFVAEAVAAQLSQGFAIGPQSPLAGEVAKLIAEMTGAERVTFCNTGSEAVMAAMRVARTVTGRVRIVTFANDYHGQFDEVLIKPGRAGAPPKALPASPGVPPDSIANMVVLPYGEDESLKWIAANAAELAAVVVEPVQSRDPELRPVEFLRQLRAITANAGAALVFDEVVTGFRVHPGGIQALWDIKADLTTYGKVLGGGMPIGVLAGGKRFMDALDGGYWRYGDESVPETAPTFFAGTFVRHPLVLAAAKAVLLHLKQQGPALQEALAARTQDLVARINADFARRGLVQRTHGFSSWFYVTLGAQDWLGSLFYPLLRLKGVNIQEGFPCFLTTAHSQADIDAIATAFAEALDELQSADILAASAADAPQPAPASTPAPPREAPVTEPQMEIWLAAQLGAEASCAFNESLTLTLSGPLDTGCLAGALNDVLSRHDALRSRFLADGESFEVAPALTISLDLLEAETEAAAEALLADVVAHEARTPFDLGNGPLVRAALVRLAPERHALVLTSHHMVCDGWSFNVILDEVAACYRARQSGASHGLPAPMSFAQHAIDTRARASDGAERFWLHQYADTPTLPALPTDRPCPAQRSFGGDTYTAHFDAAFLNALKKAGARHGATLFTTLLAGLQALVGRLANHSDIVVAVPTAGQSLVGDRVLVGHCVNFLPLRAPFDWSTRFCDHLAFLQRRVLDAFEHQDYTYGTLLRKLQRTPNRLPLTEIQFNLERLSSQLDFGGAVGVSAPNPKAFVNFHVFLNCIESADGLRIDCDYNTDVLDRATIVRWIGHYRTLLEGAIADASREIAHLPLLSADEQTWLLDTLNDTALARPPSQRVEAMIAAQAAVRGGAVACIDAARTVSYAELEARANRLARQIAQAAPGGGGRVAIALERSRDLVVAPLAVLKAGHTYVPLDPDLPAARLQQILQEADVAVYLCDDDAGAAAAPAGAGILRLDRISLDDGDASPLPASDAREDAPAYVIFTSGTTGKPKGVEISHRALTNFLSSIVERPGFTDRDTIVAATTISFDIAALELLAPLLAGGRVAIASRDAVRDGYALVKLIDEHKATVVQATPSLWKLLLEAGFAPRADLRMLCGGENLPRDLADRLLVGGPLWNLYGPTESTIWSSAGRVEPNGPIVIGAPVANTQLYILDERDQLAPIGAVGMLHIGGMGLANGYFRQPELTQKAFRTLSIAGRPRQRLYNTGDHARRLPSGDIQVLGRADDQIKLRGFRIELEEIEITLRKAPGVQACAVALRDDVGSEPALAAYYVAPRDLNAAELAAFMRERLPDYMTPSHWMRLERLPLSPSRKLDRRALPTPTIEPAHPRAVEAARTPLEAQIAEVWEDVLGRSNIGVNDPIFALGADSLQIFRIAARLSKQGLAVEARELMKNPTVAAVAKTLDGVPAEAREAPVRSGPSLADFRHGARRQVAPS